ncbi:MAG: DegT/DnrJ/EryC1/StrS family aminotransferase [Candidatus Sumerlaeota bacterium]|nr:DegT/DnrJ/EryC1/StrS family aminotransferase [Candidatus Sumerlaeota bacterium]
MGSKSKLAIHGGPKAVTIDRGGILKWPIVTSEDEEAVLEVLRRGAMSGNDVTKKFEAEFAAWIGTKYALSYPNGTEALRAATWACGVGVGDEIICPSVTYWASATPALGFGATVNFAEIRADTTCIDPEDIEHRIGPRTKAIMVVHYGGYPCDMDAIMAIARRHGLKVIEDVSHAHGALCNGRMAGTVGDVGAMSLMSGKPLCAGEAGMLVTNDRAIYEMCIAYGFYERTVRETNYVAGAPEITLPELQRFAGVPLGGFKHRLNQTCSAMGRVQLKHYPERNEEIGRAMNRFWDLLEGCPGIRAHRPPKGSKSKMGGWYNARGLYRAEELGGLPIQKFYEAVTAEGVPTGSRCNAPLHLHPVFQEADLFRQGQPTVIAFGQRDVRQGPGALPVSERIRSMCFGVPWFKHDRPDIIEQHALAFRKVAENASQLM